MIWGLAGSIREVTQSPLQSFPVKLEHELGGEQYHEECSEKTIRYMGCMGIPECFLVKSGEQENVTAPGIQNPTDDYNPDPCSTVELTRIRNIRRGIKNPRLC